MEQNLKQGGHMKREPIDIYSLQKKLGKRLGFFKKLFIFRVES